MKTTLDILVAARALIEKPEKWCQGVLARTARGREVAPENRRASRFCAIGALISVGGGEAFDLARLALMTVLRDGMVSVFNNTHTHPEVLALFDRAIATEKRKLGIIDDKIAGQVRDLLANAAASTAVPESVT